MKLYQKITLGVKIILGFILYHFFPRKKIVLILSSMRSGSTLLKALLGTAPDVSHLNEYNFLDYKNKFLFYYNIYNISNAKIIVLKKPTFYDNHNSYLKFPYKSKKIILIRNPIDTSISILKMNESHYIEKTIDEIINYWITSYDNMKTIIDDDVIIVRYNDIINAPKKTTKELFNFIESSSSNGVDTYSRPISGSWKWGNDDGSKVIKKLKVVNMKKNYSNYKSLIKKTKAHEKIHEIISYYDLEMPKIFFDEEK
jgi:hypothetical protein